MGKQKTYSWEFKGQMVHLLAKGPHNMSQISRDYHVTRSLLYAWIRLYQERGEAAFVPDRASASPPEIERPQNAEERVAYLERLCGQQALELDVWPSEVDVLKKAWHQLPSVPGHALIEHLRELMPTVSVRKLCSLLNINRQWYYQRGCPSVQQDRDRSLCLARHLLRKDFAGYGYRRMTKARKPGWLEDQSQASRARDAASGSDLPT